MNYKANESLYESSYAETYQLSKQKIKLDTV